MKIIGFVLLLAGAALLFKGTLSGPIWLMLPGIIIGTIGFFIARFNSL